MAGLLPVIVFTQEFIVLNRLYAVDGRRKGLLVETFFQNGFHMFVGAAFIDSARSQAA